MKIWHILDHFLPYLSGYSIRSKNIIECQMRLGFSITVITSPKHLLSSNNESIMKEVSYYSSYFPSNRVIKQINKIPFLREILLINQLKKDILKLIRKLGSPDIIHAHSPTLCGLPALFIAQRYKIPIVYEVRALWEEAAIDLGRFKKNSFKYKLSKLIETNLLKRVDAITTICQGLKDNMVLRGINENKIYIIPNGVDTSKFTPKDKNTPLIQKYQLQDKIVLGFIGSFYNYEGLEYLIWAMDKISKYNDNIRLLLVGGGEEENNLKKLTQELNLANKIIFTGQISHNEILNYYSVIDILIYPRINIPLTNLVTGLKLLEAMSMEKAIIASDVGGNIELIKDGITGLLFKSGNIDDLITKCLLLVDNKEKRYEIGHQARSDMINNRNWRKIILKYSEIYKQLGGK